MNNIAIISVDDEKIILDSLRLQFERNFDKKYIFEFAESAEEALDLIDELNTKSIDVLLVISDYQMPGMKGDEFAIILSQKLPHIKRILLTGQISEKLAAELKSKNIFTTVLSKPWSEENLINLIKNIESMPNNKAILIVDDEFIIIESLKMQLNRIFPEEFIIECASSGQEARAIMDDCFDNGIDILLTITDLNLDDCKGTDLLNYCNEKFPNAKKIILSGNSNNELVTSYANTNMLHAIINKPWFFEDLKETLFRIPSLFS